MKLKQAFLVVSLEALLQILLDLRVRPVQVSPLLNIRELRAAKGMEPGAAVRFFKLRNICLKVFLQKSPNSACGCGIFAWLTACVSAGPSNLFSREDLELHLERLYIVVGRHVGPQQMVFFGSLHTSTQQDHNNL